jgi:para-nitrobenzyl esterase
MVPGESLLLQLESDEELRIFIMQQSPRLAQRPASDTDKLISAYRMGEPNASRLQMLIHITTDVWIWRDTVIQADLQRRAERSPVFCYEFRWSTPCFGSQWAPHGAELPFVFDNLDYALLFDEHDLPKTRADADPENHRARLRDQIVNAWVTFARTGDPTTPALGWPAYRQGRDSVMIFDKQSSVTDNPWAPYRRQVLEMFPRADLG